MPDNSALFWDEKPTPKGGYQFIECQVADLLYLRVPTILENPTLKNGGLDSSHVGRTEGFNTLARHMELGYEVLASQRYTTRIEQGFEFILIRKK